MKRAGEDGSVKPGEPPVHHMLRGHEVVSTEDFFEWGRWFETADRHIRQTRLRNGKLVSTIFLGIDYSFGLGGPPLLFESMIFAPRAPGETFGEGLAQARCTTWEEAEMLHGEMLKRACARTRTHVRSNVGSPYPIDRGASTRILWRRVEYGGRKGIAARRRLRALERRIARTGIVDTMLRETRRAVTAPLGPVLRVMNVDTMLRETHRAVTAPLGPVLRFMGVRR